MSIHIYENGTVGAQDGTEVTFLHFDGGAMATGESKTVSKRFYIRTDGEEIEHIEISIGAISDDGTAIYKDKSYYSENKFKIVSATLPKEILYECSEPSNNDAFVLSRIGSTNIEIRILATLFQSDGESDTRARLFFSKTNKKIEVVSALGEIKDINIYTGDITVGGKDGISFKDAKCKLKQLKSGSYSSDTISGENYISFAVRCKDGFKASNVNLIISPNQNSAIYLRSGNVITTVYQNNSKYALGTIKDTNTLITMTFDASKNNRNYTFSLTYDELVALQ